MSIFEDIAEVVIFNDKRQGVIEIPDSRRAEVFMAAKQPEPPFDPPGTIMGFPFRFTNRTDIALV